MTSLKRPGSKAMAPPGLQWVGGRLETVVKGRVVAKQ